MSNAGVRSIRGADYGRGWPRPITTMWPACRRPGYHVDNCLIDFGQAGAEKPELVGNKRYDAVLIGAGVRLSRITRFCSRRSSTRRTASTPSAASCSTTRRLRLLLHPPVVSGSGLPDPGALIMSVLQKVDVLVIGAGPTGLTAAGDLARRGRSVVVLERWPDVNPSSRAFATMARTLGSPRRPRSGRRCPRPVASGTRCLHLRRCPNRPDPPGFGIPVRRGNSADQYRPRPRRLCHLSRAPSPPRVRNRGPGTGFRGVTVTARPKDDADAAHRITFRADYLIGADGAHSTVRDLVGMDFPGKDHPVVDRAGRCQARRWPERRRAHPRQYPRAVRPCCPLRPQRRARRVVPHDGVGSSPPGARQRARRARRKSSMCWPGRWDAISECARSAGCHGSTVTSAKSPNIATAVCYSRRRGTRPLADGRAGHEHRYPGRGQSRMEDRRGPLRR